jgi:hypothetical protein
MKKFIIITISSLLLSSCTQSLFNFTIVSTKNIELSKLSELEQSKERVVGEDKAYIIVVIPTNTIKIDQAISNTINSVPGCVALLDGVVYSKFWYIPYVYGVQKFVIEATPLIDPSMANASMPLPKFGKVYIDKKGQVDSIETITEGEYLAEKNSILPNSTVVNKDFVANEIQ